MKNKLLIFSLLLISLFFGTSIVNADDNSNVANWNYFYTSQPNFTDDFVSKINVYNTYSDEIDTLKEYFNNNWSSLYDYYYIQYFNQSTYNNNGYIVLYPTNSNIFNVLMGNEHLLASFSRIGNPNLCYYYDISNNTFSVSSNSNFPIDYSIPLYTNFDYSFLSSQYAKLVLPSYTDNDYDIPSYELYAYDTLPTVDSLINDTYNTYTEINLNDYSYVVLSLTDYSVSPFYTNIYTLGRLCFTPVYDYGMTEKKYYYSNYQTQGCSSLYDTFTPIMISISQTDINNHSVFYIKSYNSTMVNKIKVNTSRFNITYVSSSETDPQVEIDGRSYPVIPFNDLTDTANISTNEGYISGQVCAIGDVNCEYETGIGLDISDIFTQPLTVLENVWASITSVFLLITKFIMLIPSPLREFLISSFMLAVVLGLIKIIL